MAGAVICSLLRSFGDETRLFLYSPTRDKLIKYESERVTICASNAEVAHHADYLFLCVKPQVIFDVLSELRGAGDLRDTCFVSIAAGVRIEQIKFALGFDAKVVRAMPNTPLTVGRGASGVCSSSPVSEDELRFVCNIFRAGGAAVVVDEADMDAVTAVSGSGPAYVYRFVNDIAAQGAAFGLSYESALDLAVSTLEGACAMLRANVLGGECTPDTVQRLIDSVTSPNGTTYAALCSLDRDQFDTAVKNAVSACAARSKELSEGK